jgi:peptidoglycan/LPS O-acetylase OafA/YrhL
LTGTDGLRALACLAIFFCHIQQHWALIPWLGGTRYLSKLLYSCDRGVAVFFVLSGFLLSMPFWRAHRRGSAMPDLKVYAIRRLARIAPAYWVCILVLTAVYGLWHTPWDRVALLLTLSFTNSLVSATHVPWYDTPLWSIGVEMLFYGMLPIVAVGMFRLRTARGARLYCVGIIGLLAVGQWLFLRAAPGIEHWVHNPTLFRADPLHMATSHNAPAMFTHFLIGVLAADWYLVLAARRGAACPDPGRGGQWCNRYDWISAGALLLLVWSAADPRWDLPGMKYLYYRWPTLHILVGVSLATLPFSRRMGAWLDNRFLRTTATLSFGIYIWHAPVQVWLRKPMQHWLGPQYLGTGTRWYLGTLVFSLVALACTYAVAAASYGLLERPILHYVHQRHDVRRGRRPALARIGGALSEAA